MDPVGGSVAVCAGCESLQGQLQLMREQLQNSEEARSQLCAEVKAQTDELKKYAAIVQRQGEELHNKDIELSDYYSLIQSQTDELKKYAAIVQRQEAHFKRQAKELEDTNVKLKISMGGLEKSVNSQNSLATIYHQKFKRLRAALEKKEAELAALQAAESPNQRWTEKRRRDAELAAFRAAESPHQRRPQKRRKEAECPDEKPRRKRRRGGRGRRLNEATPVQHAGAVIQDEFDWEDIIGVDFMLHLIVLYDSLQLQEWVVSVELECRGKLLAEEEAAWVRQLERFRAVTEWHSGTRREEEDLRAKIALLRADVAAALEADPGAQLLLQPHLQSIRRPPTAR